LPASADDEDHQDDQRGPNIFYHPKSLLFDIFFDILSFHLSFYEGMRLAQPIAGLLS
jgi:hypothetical protein